MINLKEYREYWERVAQRIDGISSVLPVTLDKDMGAKIQRLSRDSVTLFILPPMAEASGSWDNFKEKNVCVIFLMKKFDPQKESAFSVLEGTQRLTELVKEVMMVDQTSGCPLMRIDISSIDTAPETELYGNFAGWSIGFNINS